MTQPCDRFEREGLADWQPGEAPDEHERGCAECQRARAWYERLGVRVAALPDVAPPDGWEERALARDANRRPEGIIVCDPVMRGLFELAVRVAQSSASVLIRGESGVGKEVLAREIQRLSPRAARPFGFVPCAALSTARLEAELFGCEKGAFTGAIKVEKGVLESSEGGTVFLDEVGELPDACQVRLARALEDRSACRIGGRHPFPIDVRFVASTHRHLQLEVDAGRFRQDLYFRLNTVALCVPPLRVRIQDIEPLATFFVADACRRARRRDAPVLAQDVLALLEAHSWPGNVRELSLVVTRAVALCEGDSIEPRHLPPGIPKPTASGRDRPTEQLRSERDTIERERMVEALIKSGSNQTMAAQLLGISRRTLVARLAAGDVPRSRKRVADAPKPRSPKKPT